VILPGRTPGELILDGRLTDKVIDYFRMCRYRATEEDRGEGAEEPGVDVEARVRATDESGWISETAEDPGNRAIGSVVIDDRSRMAKQMQISANGGRGRGG
jgi:hypothetical protein